MSTPNMAGYQAYQKNKYETASPHKLILMLFDGAVRFSKQAVSSLEKKDINQANTAILKVQGIMYELLSSINEEQGGEIAQNLKNLYLYIIDRLVQANLKKDREPLTEVIELVTEIKSSWEQIGKEQSLGQQRVSL